MPENYWRPKIYDTIRLPTSIHLQTLAATRDTKSVTQDVRVEYTLLIKKYYHHDLLAEIWDYEDCTTIAVTWDIVLYSLLMENILQAATSSETIEATTLQGVIFQNIVTLGRSSGLAGGGRGWVVRPIWLSAHNTFLTIEPNKRKFYW